MRIEEYQNLRGRLIFGEWFEDLDTRTALIINTILTRMQHGNNSNIKSVGGGVYERTVDYGPGYRIYFGKEGSDLILLLYGGSNKKQQKDIDQSKLLWKEYKDRKKS